MKNFKTNHKYLLGLYVKIGLLIIIVLTLTWGCTEEEEDTCFKCLYERRTTGCNNSSYGSWDSREIVYNTEDIKAGLSKQDVCDLIMSTSNCEAGCCIKYQIRNVTLEGCGPN